MNARVAWSISGHGTSLGDWATNTYGQYHGRLDAHKAAQAVNAPVGHDKSPTGKNDKKDHGKAKGQGRLSRLFEDSATRVGHTRLALRRLAADIEPARTRLTDPVTLMTNVLTAVDAPTRLPQAAARPQRQGAHADSAWRLAEQADGGDGGDGGDGKWTSADGPKAGDKPPAQSVSDVRDPQTLNWLRHHAATYGFVNDIPEREPALDLEAALKPGGRLPTKTGDPYLAPPSEVTLTCSAVGSRPGIVAPNTRNAVRSGRYDATVRSGSVRPSSGLRRPRRKRYR